MAFRVCPLVLLLFVYLNSIGQEVPAYRYYSSQEYEASAQNWEITHSEDGTLYFANNDGILVLEASHWQLLPSINQSIVRSVLADDGRLYAGMYMEFGYYERDARGIYRYTSIASQIKSSIVEDEQFWNIFRAGDQVIFQSLDQLIAYEPQSGKMQCIPSPHQVVQGFVSNQRIFIQDRQLDVLELKNGVWEMIAKSVELEASNVSMVNAGAGGVVELLTDDGKLYRKESVKWEIVRDLGLNVARVYSASMLSDRGIVLGTISDGIRVYDEQWELRYNIGSKTGIRNNTVLSLHQDQEQNIWLGLDNGIICINHTGALSGYVDQQNDIGTIYATARHNGWAYLGTNIGLFARQEDSDEPYHMIAQSSGQVWSLQVVGDHLLMGHNKGSFAVKEDRILPTGGLSGTWKFISMPDGKSIIAGTYQGIDLLQLEEGRWKWVRKLSGFQLSSRHLEVVSPGKWLVSHEYKGVFQLEVDDGLYAVTRFQLIPEFGREIHSSLASFDHSVWYYSRKGLFRFDPKGSGFIRQQWADPSLDSARYLTGKMVPIGKDRLCFFQANAILLMHKNLTDETFRFQIHPVAVSQIKPMLGFENVSQWVDDRLILGGVNQYLLLNTGATVPATPAPRVHSCVASANGLEDIIIDQAKATIPGSHRTVRLRFGSAVHRAFQDVLYQYRLEGLPGGWSEWSAAGEVTFTDLPSGNYVFRLRAALAGAEPSPEQMFSFRMEPSFAERPMMIVLYLIGLSIVILLVHKTYTGYYRKQRRKLVEENDKNMRLRQLTMEQEYAVERNRYLQEEFERKKKELAQTLIHLNKNVELLAEAKDHLALLPGETHRVLLQKIEANLSDEDSWNLLQTAFLQVDSGFMERLRNLNADLSPSDLKFCVYLRLNLSGKEIAALLNISAKSVEIKRYRLRKKLGLGQQVSLQQFILSL